MSKNLKVIFVLVFLMVVGVMLFLKNQYSKPDSILQYLPADIDKALYIKTPTIVNGLMKYPGEKMDTLMNSVQSIMGFDLKKMHKSGIKPYSGILYLKLKNQYFFMLKLSNSVKFKNIIQKDSHQIFHPLYINRSWYQTIESKSVFYISKDILFGFPYGMEGIDTNVVHQLLNFKLGKPSKDIINHFNKGGHLLGLNNSHCQIKYKCLIGVGELKFKSHYQKCDSDSSITSFSSFTWDARKEKPLPNQLKSFIKSKALEEILTVDYTNNKKDNSESEINLNLKYKTNNFALDKALGLGFILFSK